MKKTHGRKVLDMARRQGILRARDLAAHDIPREYLTRLVKRGYLVREGRGLYALPDRPVSGRYTLAQVTARIPEGVICLVSALSFHGIGTQLPSMVWVAVPRTSRRQRKFDYPPIRLCVYSDAAYMAGVICETIDGREVRIYDAAKTIADCFKYRNKIGLDVALEALQEGWRQKQFSMRELEKYAEICRVKQVMRPYLEALVL